MDDPRITTICVQGCAIAGWFHPACTKRRSERHSHCTLGLASLSLEGTGLSSERTGMEDKDLVVVWVDRKKGGCAEMDT